MSDELTPEEQEALRNLPRERMPSAQLEERVVGAMRARGVLAPKPGRVVRLTNSSFAGLIAATIVLMVGAYSIGLHRGGENEVIRGAVDTRTKDVSTMLSKEEFARAPQSEPVPSASNQETQAEPEAEEKAKANEGRADEPAQPAREQTARTLESQASKMLDDAVKKDSDDAGTFKRQNAPHPPSASGMAYDATTPRAGMAASPDEPAPRFFRLGGTAFIIEAPDSVRIVQDEAGRVLLLYTSDGIFRIRLAD